MTKPLDALRNGVVLAELGGHGDGPYCARHGAGGALVILGTYIVDPGDDVPYPNDFTFKSGQRKYLDYLRKHVAAARGGGAKVGVSVVTVRMEDTLDFFQAAEEAGADYVSYCAYSSMEMFTGRGLSSALCLRANWAELGRWAKAMAACVSVPVIFKMGLDDPEETVGAAGIVTEAGIRVLNVVLHDVGPGSGEFGVLPRLRQHCDVLISGGGIRGVADARRFLDSGADAVAIGTAAMEDAGLIGRIQKALRS
jgi:dihydroorotate dehydrogenase